MKPSLAEVNSLRPHDKSDRRIPWHREGKLTLSRRHFLHAGAAAGLLGIAGRPAITAAASFAPQIDPRLKARALPALAAKRSSIPNAAVIGIAAIGRAYGGERGGRYV